jgi:hypothetical protein
MFFSKSTYTIFNTKICLESAWHFYTYRQTRHIRGEAGSCIYIIFLISMYTPPTCTLLHMIFEFSNVPPLGPTTVVNYHTYFIDYRAPSLKTEQTFYQANYVYNLDGLSSPSQQISSYSSLHKNWRSQRWGKHPSYYMPRKRGLIFLMPRTAVTYLRIGTENAVLTARAGTSRTPADTAPTFDLLNFEYINACIYQRTYISMHIYINARLYQCTFSLRVR